MTSSAGILYQKLKTSQHHYIYDTYSNQILEVTEALWHAADRLLGSVAGRHGGVSSDYETGAPSTHETPADDVLLREIAAARDAGYLGEVDIRGMQFCEPESGLTDLIRTRIPQLSLEVTEKCTSRCRYCAYSYDTVRCQQPRDMEWRTAANAIDLFMRHSDDVESRAISFWGGEPLLNIPLITRVFDHIEREYRHQRVGYSFTTNASLITPFVAHTLASHDVSLLVSLDGPQHIHDRHRVTASGTGTYADTLRGLSVLAEADESYYRSSVWFNCVLTPGTDLREVIDFFSSDLRVEGHNVQFSFVSGLRNPFYQDQGPYGAEQVAQFRRLMVDALTEPYDDHKVLQAAARSRLARIAVRPRSPIGQTIHPNGCCAPFLKKMHVAVDGGIHLCERVGYDNPLGNVNQDGIDYKAAYRLTTEYCRESIADCRTCWAVRLCSLCFRGSVSRLRWVQDDRAERCDRARATVLEGLREYTSVLEQRPDAFSHINIVVA